MTRLAPALAALAAAAVGAVGVRLRRLEIAAALHAGATRSSVFAVLSAETIIWSTAAAAEASGLAAAQLLGVASVSVATGTLTALLAAAAALPGVLAAASGTSSGTSRTDEGASHRRARNGPAGARPAGPFPCGRLYAAASALGAEVSAGRAFLAVSTRAVKVAGSFTASSARMRRSTSTPARPRPWMKRL